MQKLYRGIIIFVTVTTACWFYLSYPRSSNLFYGDTMGYYMFLPATFIYHNNDSITKFPPGRDIPSSVTYYVQGMEINNFRTPKGYLLPQYTYGIAFLESPFFFMAHAYEKLKGRGANGYSEAYEMAMKICTMFYALLGLLLIYRVLIRYFSKTQSLLALAFIFLGTNLFWFTLYQQGMAHVPLMFLYALLIYLSMRLHQQPAVPWFLAVAFVAGLITVIRPTDVICLAIPLFYNVYNKETLLQRWLFIKRHARTLVPAAIVFALPILPQLIYWKIYSGHFLFYSYGAQEFNWKHPRLMDGLFYFNNGWLPYSPIMIFSLLGLLLYLYIKPWAWVLWMLIPVYIYIIYSWYCFNYINGLGSRPMIHMYPLLALPLAAVIHYISRRIWMVKVLFSAVCLFFIAVNISYSMQRATGLLVSEESNFYFNAQTLFKTKLNYNDLVVYDLAEWQPDTSKITRVMTLACQDYEDSISDRFVLDTLFGSKYVYAMGEEEHHPCTITLSYRKELFGDAKWFRCSGRFNVYQEPDYFKHMFVISVKRGKEYVFWKACKIDNKIANLEYRMDHFTIHQWGTVSYFVKIPNGLRDGDEISLDMWNPGKRRIFMDDICLELYK